MWTLTDKVIVTLQTMWQQYKCPHGPWILDPYETEGRQTCHCQQCCKVQFDDTFAFKLARKETYDEWILRATKAGMPLDTAIEFWEKF